MSWTTGIHKLNVSSTSTTVAATTIIIQDMFINKYSIVRNSRVHSWRHCHSCTSAV